MSPQALRHELAHNAETIRALVAGISQEEARVRPTPESWSVLEVVCHLGDEEVEDFRQRLDYILHRPGETWPPIDPDGWVAARGYNDRDLGEMLDGFLAERQKSLAWLDGLAAPDWDAAYETRFGPMRAGDMLASWAAHDVLHLRQLVELRRARVVAMAGAYDVRYAGEW